MTVYLVSPFQFQIAQEQSLLLVVQVVLGEREETEVMEEALLDSSEAPEEMLAPEETEDLPQVEEYWDLMLE